MNTVTTAQVSSARSIDDFSVSINFGNETNALDVIAADRQISLSTEGQMQQMSVEDLKSLMTEVAKTQVILDAVPAIETLVGLSSSQVVNGIAPKISSVATRAAGPLGAAAAVIEVIPAVNKSTLETIDGVLEEKGLTREERDALKPSLIQALGISSEQQYVNAIQKCHRLRKAGMSPSALTVARLSSPETSNIVGLKSLAETIRLICRRCRNRLSGLAQQAFATSRSIGRSLHCLLS